MDNIIFTDTIGVPEMYCPQPANKILPDWYKTLNSYDGGKKAPGGNGETTATIKKCMPVFDAISAGYFLFTYTDIFVTQKLNNDGKKYPWFEWPSFSPISFHSIWQVPNYPKATNLMEIPKFINPWAIKTPKGYSTLFVEPFHRDSKESFFDIMAGVVDTDKYSAPVNIVFTLKNRDFEGLIPAGTPICQVIPFKRGSWEMKIGKTEDVKNANNIVTLLQTRFFEGYKSLFRQPKDYR